MSLDFSDVDHADAAACIAFLDKVFSLEEARKYKRRSIAMLRLRQGDRVLEVGCGTGEDAVTIAKRIGTGEVVGIDLSHAMIATARQRAGVTPLPIRFEQADLHALPFEPELFQAVRIDRVLHIVANPGAALSEIARVTAKGGRVVATESDWNTLCIQGSDPALDQRLRQFIAGLAKADTGSRLRDYFSAAGLEVFGEEQIVFATRDLDHAASLMNLEGIAAAALAANTLTEDEVVRWLHSLQNASQEGSFSATLTGYTVGGVKVEGAAKLAALPTESASRNQFSPAASGKAAPVLEQPFLAAVLSDQVSGLYPTYAQLRKLSPIVRDKSGALLVTTYSSVAKILRDSEFALLGPQLFNQPSVLARMRACAFLNVLMFSDQAAHRSARGRLAGLFTPPTIGAIAQQAQRFCREVFAGGAEVDASHGLSEGIANQSMALLLGIDPDALAIRLARGRSVANLLAAVPMDGATLLESIAAFEDLTHWLADTLLRSEGPCRSRLHFAGLSDHEALWLFANLSVVLVTGHDTLKAMVSNAMATLWASASARHAVETADLTKLAVADEFIRFETAGQIVFRHAINDIVLDGYQIKKHELLALLIGSANRDAGVFTHPDTLSFTSHLHRPLSFGLGPHTCIGAALAKTVLTGVLGAFAAQIHRVVPCGALPTPKQFGLIRWHDGVHFGLDA